MGGGGGGCVNESRDDSYQIWFHAMPIARKTGDLNESVFDVDDDTVPLRFPNGFTFLTPGELVNNQSCRFSCSISFMLSN
ncbi:hypothetical protein Peur_023984 [Populus x canadensis]